MCAHSSLGPYFPCWGCWRPYGDGRGAAILDSEGTPVLGGNRKREAYALACSTGALNSSETRTRSRLLFW